MISKLELVIDLFYSLRKRIRVNRKIDETIENNTLFNIDIYAIQLWTSLVQFHELYEVFFPFISVQYSTVSRIFFSFIYWVNAIDKILFQVIKVCFLCLLTFQINNINIVKVRAWNEIWSEDFTLICNTLLLHEGENILKYYILNIYRVSKSEQIMSHHWSS